MRVFLSSFENFVIAIPIDFVSSILIYRDNANNENEENNETNNYISLPEFFNQKINIHHGIKLKNSNIVLLTSRVDSEIDIPQKEIYRLPKAFNAFSFSKFFSGIKITNENIILFLNLKQFLKKINKEGL